LDRYGAVSEPATPGLPSDPPWHWVEFHLAHPEPGPVGVWDPGAIFHWKGRYHLFYVHPGEGADAYAHVSSTDMVHWEWHPTTLTPARMGHGMWAAVGFVTKAGRPAMIYHGPDGHRPASSNQIIVAADDLLESWGPPTAVTSRVRPDQDGSVISYWDPYAWLDGDTYYAVFANLSGKGWFAEYGGPEKQPTLHRSPDLVEWEYVGPLLSDELPEDDADAGLWNPNLFPLGAEHMLLWLSHEKGSGYFLGEWKDEQFTPRVRGRFNWYGFDVWHAQTVLTPDGRRVMWAWCWFETARGDIDRGTPDAQPAETSQRGIQTLPRELSLPSDGILRIAPLRELESLRADEVRCPDVRVPSGATVVVERVAGDTLELAVSIRPGSATRVSLGVHCDSTGSGGVGVTVDREAGTLSIGEASAPFDLNEGEPLTLRVFVDKHVVEVFANDRQAIVYSHVYDRSSNHFALTAAGDDISADVTAWRMRSVCDPAPA
jgi:beta-fructofuranosidase